MTAGFTTTVNDNGFAIVSANGAWFACTPSTDQVEIRAVRSGMPLKSTIYGFAHMEKCGSNNTVLSANGNRLAFASGNRIHIYPINDNNTDKNPVEPVLVDIPEAFTSATMQLGIFNSEQHVWLLIDSGPHAGLSVYDMQGRRIANTSLTRTELESTAHNTGPDEITVIYNDHGACTGAEKILLKNGALSSHELHINKDELASALRIDGIVNDNSTLLVLDDELNLYEKNRQDWMTINHISLNKLDKHIVTTADIDWSDFTECDVIEAAPYDQQVLLLLVDDTNDCQYICSLEHDENHSGLKLESIHVIRESFNTRPRRILARGMVQCIAGRNISFDPYSN